MKILYAEDEKSIRDAISAIFQIKGYELVTVADGEMAVQEATTQLFDIILLDIMMPKMDGLTALQKMRQNQIYTPIILLTAKGQTDDVIRGLDMGADDYIKKPFEASELITRIEILYRRESNYASQIITFDDVKLDKKENKLYTEKESLSVSPTEMAIFKYLARMVSAINVNEISMKIKQPKEDVEFYARCLQKKIAMLNSNVELEIKDNKYKLITRKTIA